MKWVGPDSAESPVARTRPSGAATVPVATASPTSQPKAMAAPVAQPPATDQAAPTAKTAMTPLVDQEYNVHGSLPANWTVRDRLRWGAKETTVFLFDPNHTEADPSIYYKVRDKPAVIEPDKVYANLMDQARYKEKSRQQKGLEGYANTGDYTSETINGRPALTWSATFTRDGQPWTEVLTQIYSPNATLLVYVSAPATDLQAIRPQVTELAHSMVIP